MSVDLSALRPWELGQVDAYQWTEWIQMANAYHQAIREVDQEAEAERGLRQDKARD